MFCLQDGVGSASARQSKFFGVNQVFFFKPESIDFSHFGRSSRLTATVTDPGGVGSGHHAHGASFNANFFPKKHLKIIENPKKARKVEIEV